MRLMSMESTNQYLEVLRGDYLKASKKEKASILNEAEKRTGLARKYLIRKLRPQNNLRPELRKKRKEYYDSYVKVALARIWEILNYPCGQRLAPQLQETDIVERLRKQGELVCLDKVASQLRMISSTTIDEKLKHEKEVLHLSRKKGQVKSDSLLLKKIPVKVHSELDNSNLGNIEIDFVEHCGSSAAGDFACTIDTIDITSGWQEWEAILGRGRIRTKEGLERVRNRYPLTWQEIHPDNDTGFVNAHLYQYTQETNLLFSRSRPYKKNDNCLIEGRNWFSVRKKFGYLRFDTKEEIDILNDLYRNELRLYQNFFQPIMKLKEKIRIGGKIHRKYEKAKTPYQRIIESNQISREKKQELKALYLSLNPAQLKRAIEVKLDMLYQVYKLKQRSFDINIFKKLKPHLVTNYTVQRQSARLPSYTV